MRQERFRRAVLAGAAAVALSAGVAACGGDDGDGGGGAEGGSLPAKIPVTVVSELTGKVAIVGQGNVAGIKLGVERCNESGKLGDSKIELTVHDYGSEDARAASLVAQAVSSDAVAVIGPGLSSATLAAAPIAQKGGLPYLALQSFVNGVVETGDHIYRLSTPQAPLSGMVVDHLEELGVKKVAFIYASDNPSTTELAEKFYPPRFEELGIEIVASEGTPMTATDYSALVSKIVGSKPDAVGVLTVGAPTPTIVADLRDQGFDGAIFGQGGAAGTFGPAGKKADGVFYPIDFTLELPHESSKEFIEAFEAENGDPPSVFSANGYDAVTFLCDALSKAESGERDDVLAAMQEVSSSGGFEGAVGPATFAGEGNRDVRAPGALVELEGGKERIVTVGEAGSQESE